jgi:tetratricopeptide (TPR) repeat protein
MPHILTFRQLLLSFLALWCDLSQKEIGARAGIDPKDVHHFMRRRRQGELKDDDFERLLTGLGCSPEEVSIVSACLESLQALKRADQDLTPEERAKIEEAILLGNRLEREALTEAVRLSRAAPDSEGYPAAYDLAPAQRRAEEFFLRLERRTPDLRLVMVEEAEEFQTWYLCERVCRESTHAASRDLEEAAAWAHLAQEIAARVRAPEGFRNRIQGYALAHAGNLLRVSGKLKQADTTFEEAKRLWHSGSDPAKVLDPGRLLDLEASLRIDQRRLDEALARLEEAVAVGRCPERALIQKAITLEEMGQYEAAVEILLQAEPRVERAGDPRLLYSQRFNLAANLVHLGRYIDGAELIPQVREVAIDLGDEIFLSRITWLESRIAAGLGRTRQARTLLAEVRRDFELRHMSYDVALALLEEAILLFDAGQTAEVQVLADELTKVFADKGVHREALAALRLFYNAAKDQKATAEMARRVLEFLQRARHDRDLGFEL